MTQMKDGIILAQFLADKTIITQKQADEFDVYKNAENMDDLLDSLLN